MMGTHTRYNDGCSQLQPLLDTCYSLCLLATMMATCTHYSDAGSTGYDDGYWLQQWLVYSLQRCLLAMATGYDYGWSPRCSLLAARCSLRQWLVYLVPWNDGYALRRWLVCSPWRWLVYSPWRWLVWSPWRWLVWSLLATTMAGLVPTRYDDGCSTRYDDGWSGRWLMWPQDTRLSITPNECPHTSAPGWTSAYRHRMTAAWQQQVALACCCSPIKPTYWSDHFHVCSQCEMATASRAEPSFVLWYRPSNCAVATTTAVTIYATSTIIHIHLPYQINSPYSSALTNDIVFAGKFP